MKAVLDITLPNPIGEPVKFKMGHDPDFRQDINMGECLRRFGGCEPEVASLMMRVLKPNDVAVDVGAAAGYFTCLMGRLVGSSGLVWAIEPGVNNQHKLVENIKLNGISTTVEVVKAAAWHRDERAILLHLSEDSGENSLRQHGSSVGQSEVSAVRLDSKINVCPRLVKMDIEGAESAALVGLESLLPRIPFITCELNEEALKRFGNSANSVRRFMHGHGYEMFVLHGNGALPSLVPRPTTVKSSRLNLNVLFSTVEQVAKAWPEIEL